MDDLPLPVTAAPGKSDALFWLTWAYTSMQIHTQIYTYM